MDQVYSFNLKKGKAHTVNPRTGNPGELELHPVEGTVFLFKGAMDAAECEAALVGEVSTYAVAANSNSPGFVVYDGNQSEFTVFAAADTKGYVRISESDKCSLCRSCLEL